jgi:REP element-mobilizing transposase RayT
MRDIFEPGVTCHVFNRGNNKEDVFKEERNYTFFLELMKKYLLPYTDIHAYCLMKNHCHLLLRFKKMRLSQKYADDADDADDTDSRR